jgi:hypothetical protein
LPIKKQGGALVKTYRMSLISAADAAFRAEQQQVAIPGWPLYDQKDVLHQEGQLTSRKKARYNVL